MGFETGRNYSAASTAGFSAPPPAPPDHRRSTRSPAALVGDRRLLGGGHLRPVCGGVLGRQLHAAVRGRRMPAVHGPR